MRRLTEQEKEEFSYMENEYKNGKIGVTSWLMYLKSLDATEEEIDKQL
jgi:hypothetical protein